MSDHQRSHILFDIRAQQFTDAMRSHNIPHSRELPGEHVYYLTEMWFMWPDFGYDAEHSYILN